MREEKRRTGIGCLTLVLAPLTIAWGLVVDAGQEMEVLKGYLLLLDTQLLA